MLNQVITAPGAVQQVPAPSLPDMSDMLNQVITAPVGAQAVPASPSPDVSDMLNQVIADTGTTQEVPRPPLTKGPDAVPRASQRENLTYGNNMLNILSVLVV